MNATPILIVVLNYQTPALALECVACLTHALTEFPRAQVVLVDNGSRDDSATQFRAAFKTTHERVQLVVLPTNRGYAAGNNAVLRRALASEQPPDYVWLLNADTVVHGDALGALVACMEINPRAGIAGSRLENADGTAQHAAFRFPSIWSEWETQIGWRWMTRLLARRVIAPPPPTKLAQTDWVPGASMLIRRVVLEQVGLLDETFFAYYEDVDFCLRARQAGWETWYVPASRVEHYAGASAPPARRMRAQVPRYWFKARRTYFLKHHGRLYTLGADGAWLLGRALRRTRLVFKRAPADVPNLWSDFLANSVWMGKH